MSMCVLVVDDEKICRVTFVQELRDAGYVSEACGNAFQALRMLDEESWDVVLTDLRMPTMDGMEFLKRIKQGSPGTDVILITAYATVETAVEAMHEGAADYLTKPFKFRELQLRLEKIKESRDLREEVSRLRSLIGNNVHYAGLAGESKPMREVFSLIEKFSSRNTSVLITGETGTGKEMVARALHMTGNRKKKPFVAVPCAALPENLVESELFGHEEGAFTGATGRRRGRFEMADGGTLFLDDVDDLPLEVQPKLLRAIQEQRFERVGGEQSITVDFRLISATKRDLPRLCIDEAFREDLFFRLQGLTIALPPLRERAEDVLLLAEYFLADIARETRMMPKRLAPETAGQLTRYQWPGNVRELKNVMEHSVALTPGEEIRPEMLSAVMSQSTPEDTPFTLHLERYQGLDLHALLTRIEQAVMQWALLKSSGHQARAAEILGIPRTTLRSMLAKHRKM